MSKVIFELVVEDQGLSAQIERTRQTIRELNKEIRANPGPERFNQLAGELTKNRRQLAELTKEQRALNKQFEALKVPKDSLAGLRLEYGRLSQAVANLTAEERKSQFGQNLIKSARNTKKEIDGIEQSIGRFTGNVGNYRSALNGLGQAFAALGIGVTVNEIIGANTRISDSIADVAKTAGITIEEAQRLADTLEFRDTRTSLVDQLQIAQIGGQLGVAQDQLESFTESVDVLNVSLGDQFGGVEEITRTIAGLRNVLTDFRTDDVSGDVLKLGNALNFLEAQGAATAPTIAEFVNRLSGAAVPLGVSTDQIFGLSTALAELSINPERGATAISSLLIEISRAPDVFAKSLNLPVQEFDELVRTDLVGALTLISSTIAEGGDDTKNFAQILDELGIGRQGAIEALGKLGGNVELVNTRIKESGEALASTDSVYAEFDKKNNNAAAAVEKLQNAVVNLITSEGAQEAIEAVAKAVTNLITVLGDSIELISENKEIFAGFAAVLLSATGPGAKLNSVLLSLFESTRLAAVGMTQMSTATAASTVKTNLNAAATRVLAAVQAALPLLALATGIYLVVKAFDTYNAGLSTAEKASRAVSDAQEEIAQSSAKEVAALNSSISILQDVTASQEARAGAVKQLTDAYPEYLRGIDLEKASAAQLTEIQKALTAEIIRGSAARSKSNAQAEIAAKIVERELKVAELQQKKQAGGFSFQDIDFLIANEQQKIGQLNEQLRVTGERFDSVFKLNQPIKSLVDTSTIQKEVDLTKLSIAELEKIGTDAAKKEIERKKALNKTGGDDDKNAADKAADDRKKRAEDEAKSVEAQEKRIREIRKSLRDLSIDDEEGFNADLAELENNRTDALEKNAERLEALRKGIQERTGQTVTGSTGAEIISQLPNARPADISEANLIDDETAALNVAFDRQRNELGLQRDKTAREREAQLKALLLEVNKIAADNEVAVAENVQVDIERSFTERRDTLRRDFEERNRTLVEQLSTRQITQRQFDEQQLSNQIEQQNRTIALEQEYATRISEVVTQVRDVKIEAAKTALDAQLDAIEQQRQKDVADIEKEGGTGVTDRVSALNAKAAEEAKAAQIDFAETVKATTQDAEQVQLNAIDSVDAADQAAHESKIARIQDEEEQRKRVIAAAIDAAGQIASSIVEIQQNQTQRETEDQLKAIDEQYGKKIEAAKGNAKLEEKLEKELASKREEIQKQAGKKDQNFAIFQALINTALAITKAYSSAPPPFNFILAGITAAAGAAQIAVIKSQQFAEGGFDGKKKKTGLYPVQMWEALPSLDSGGYTGGGLSFQDDTGRRVAGKLQGSGAVVHEGEYIAPASQVKAYPELFRELEGDRLKKARPFAKGGYSTVNLGNFVHLRPFQTGGFSDPVIGLPSSAQLQQQNVVVQSNATFTDAQAEQIGRIIAAENAKVTRIALAEGLGDANRRLEREASLEEQRAV